MMHVDSIMIIMVVIDLNLLENIIINYDYLLLLF